METIQTPFGDVRLWLIHGLPANKAHMISEAELERCLRELRAVLPNARRGCVPRGEPLPQKRRSTKPRK